MVRPRIATPSYAGSSPVVLSNTCRYNSAEEYLVANENVAGSNPAICSNANTVITGRMLVKRLRSEKNSYNYRDGKKND